jgi:RNA polymerase sigma-70 factor (ECF subfamily)
MLARLDSFRGDSRFTTWAYSFAVHTALVAARREAWRTVPLDSLPRRRRGGYARATEAETAAGARAMRRSARRLTQRAARELAGTQ